MNDVLEAYVPLREETPDWDDVLRRARPFPRRRVVVAVALAVAALGGGPALGVMLTREHAPKLPAEADRSNVVVITQALTGKVLIQAAPWKGHEGGICYVILWMRSGCAPRGAAVNVTPPLAGFMFGHRIASGTGVTVAGKHVPLTVRYFPKLDVAFFLTRGRLPHLLREATLYDANGKVVKRLRLKP
jgi:hypothetical protein